jgi:hypothetical protein
MNEGSWPFAAAVLPLQPAAAIAATTTGAGLDVQKYRGIALAVLSFGAPTAGTNPTMACKVQSSPEADKVTRASVTYSGTGNGRLEVEAGPDPVAENITFTASNATTFAVVGSVSGAIGTLTVGTRFASAQVNALITAGGTAFVNTDVFTVPTTARTWTDLVAFDGLTDAASRQKKAINLDKGARYLHSVCTIGGTNSPSYPGCIDLLATE